MNPPEHPPTPPAARRRLSPRIGLSLAYHDETPFGSPVSERCERILRARFAVLYAYREKYGLARLVREAPAVLARVLPACLEGIRVDAGRLSEAWLHPEPAAVRPALLRVERELAQVVARIPLPAALVPELAAWLGDWEQGARAPAGGAARGLWDALAEAGALVATRPPAPPARTPGVGFVGHATLAIDDGASRLLVDPYLVPRSRHYPRDWQPPAPAELGRPDAVLITHSHPDHYDPGTLLRLGADTLICVPEVARESVLAIDMAARLRQLGFRRVRSLRPWDAFGVGGLRVVALPFHGEQPTVGERLHPEVRNEGLTYLVEAAGRRIAALADAGCDGAGDVRELAAQARARFGPADTVFGGHRGFALYPVQFAFSSVGRYLPFVPPGRWGERQRIMCDADDLIDVAERWSAARVVPYASGGAPWHWLRGLGPCLDGSVPNAEWAGPLPADVVAAAARRAVTRADGPIASPVSVLTLRPGERLAF